MRLRAARDAKGLRLRPAARLIGISAPTLLDIENGGGVQIGTLLKIVDAYEIRDLNPLFGRKGTRP